MTRLTRYFDKIGNLFHRLTIFLCIVAIIAIAVLLFVFYQKTKDDNIVIRANDNINLTPTLVDKMQSIGQWEFLAISDEELIDTIHRGFFSKDELVRIYYGTLRLGIDFKNCSKEWIRKDKDTDTVRITLPDITLLDHNFIDEARTKSFFESGKWSEKDKLALYERARQRMIARCLSPENIKVAEDNASVQIQQMLSPIVTPLIIKIEYKK